MKNLNKMLAAIAVCIVMAGSAYVYNGMKVTNQAAAMYNAHLDNDKAAFVEAYKNANKRAVKMYSEWVTADKEQQAIKAAETKEDAKKEADAVALWDNK